MLKFSKITTVMISLFVGAATIPAFAISSRGLAQGEKETRQLLRLMDRDQNGQVSKQEFMQFMEAEFDRMDVDHSGELSVHELSKFPFRYSPTHPGGSGSR
jgi:Ca2+-binding EF-hand superfamily protein